MPISRIYETEQQAHDAAQKLNSEFPDTTVHLVTPSSGGDAAAALANAGLGDDATTYAAEVASGRSVVSISPAFGQGVVAKAILNEAGPVAMSAALPSTARTANADYTPFSDFLGWNPLSERKQQAWWWGSQLKRHDITSLGQPRLKRYDITSLGQPRLKKYDVTSLGFARLLKNNPTPLSSMIGLPLSKPYHVASLGLPLLVKNR